MSQDIRPIYRPCNFNASNESLVVDVDVSTGSINQDDSMERAPRRCCGLIRDGDIEAAAIIEDDNPEDPIKRLSLNSPRLTPLRVFLRLTFQWFPQTASFAEKAVYTAMQILVIGFLMYCYAFDMGVFDNRSLVAEQWKETVTAAKNIIWSLRMLEMYILGVLYFRKRHLEKMLSKVILTTEYWKKTRKTIKKISLVVFLFVFLLPVGSKAVQMDLSTRKVESFDKKQIVLNVFLSVLARLFALPIFFAFIHEVYIIFSQIRYFKKQIQTWPEDDKEGARDRFIDIQNIIRDAERAFQPFLVTHLLLLLVLLIPSIFSCAERFQNEIHYQQTYTDWMEMTPNAQIPENMGLIVTNVSNFYHNKEMALFLKLTSQNKTRHPIKPKLPSQHTEYKTDVIGVVKIACSALGDFMEMFVLYSLPLVFLAKLHKIMRSLPNVVQTLKFPKQREEQYLFQNQQILDEMLGNLSTARGIQIMRIDLTGVKAAVLTLLMPFLTTAIHLLFLHVDLN